MKKIFYLAMVLCFIQVGTSSAQTSVSTDKQKKETVSPKKDQVISTSSVNTPDSKKTEAGTRTCTATKETPTCCQKKTGASACAGASSTASTPSVKNDKKK